MPLTDADKTTIVLLQEIYAAFSNPTIKAKVTELQYREIKSGDADDNSQVRGGSRPTHLPLNP